MTAMKAIPELTEKDKKRFWAKVAKKGSEECWEWAASFCGSAKYGGFHTSNGMIRANRVSWFLHHGIDPDKQVLHDCDNTRCVNPAHLHLGDPFQNMQEKVRRGRANIVKGDTHYSRTNPEKLARGEKIGTSKLTSDDVILLRKMAADGTNRKLLAQKFSLNLRTVFQIIARECWKHI